MSLAGIWEGMRGSLPHLLSEVEEVVGLVDEEELEGGAAQVVAAQVHLAQVRQGALEVVADPCRGWGHTEPPQMSPPCHSLMGMRLGKGSSHPLEECLLLPPSVSSFSLLPS